MEVGDMMTHGSRVALEYLITAVVGIYRATERLQTGQGIWADGNRGQTQILAYARYKLESVQRRDRVSNKRNHVCVSDHWGKRITLCLTCMFL